jgi:integrase
MRLEDCRAIRRFLADIRAMGLTRPGGVAARLPDDFIMSRQDIPAQPDPDEQGRDLPAWVMQILDANLHVLEERSGTDMRRMTELMMDTGRRPDEICQLRLDCLDRDAQGKPVLIYTDSKNHRPGRRLPVAEATARIIVSQQADVCARFLATPAADLPLFPRDNTNPTGTGTYNEAGFTNTHRKWINLIAGKLVTTATGEDGQPAERVFDRLAVVPYAYRHSYAQRHADEGVAPDVLRDLLGHDSIQTTLGYYRVTEKRVRAAVDRVSAHQFDGQGRRVMTEIRSLLADEHARMRVGQVAVPFGICTEPSNVKAGGQACPYKFTCLGCGHFRSDPSYLPELKSYLQQLLADRERVRAATDLQDWAKDQLAPREEEISQLRDLIRRIEADVAGLTEQDQALIAEAVTVIPKTRQLVNLGMPAVRPAAKTG